MKNSNPPPQRPSAGGKPPAAAGGRKSRWGPPPPSAAPAGDKGASTSARTPTPTHSADSRRHPAPAAPAPLARNPASPAAAFRPPPQQPAAETPPPPPYGFHNLDRRTMHLADGTVRTYFALPSDYPFDAAPLPPIPHLPRAAPDLWPSHQPPPQYMPMPMPLHDAKRKHPADQDDGFSRHPKHLRLDASRHPPQLPPHAAVDPHALRRAFLKYAKMLNESYTVKRSYLEGGRVPCLACGRFGDPALLIIYLLASFLVLLVVKFLRWFISVVELALVI